MIKPFINWACPLDNQPMKRIDNMLRCSQKHAYDYARQGYVNLLPAQFKHSHSPGDNDIMVQARRDFLNTGLYNPIADMVVDCICKAQNASSATDICVVDAGCGEGYYTLAIADKLEKHYPDKSIQMMGFDISKNCIGMATKRNKTRDWAVATNAHIPVQTETVDYVCSLFGFPVVSEFVRVLKKGGLLITIDAGPQHLMELRQCVYDTVIVKDVSNAMQDKQLLLTSEQKQRFKLSDLSFETADALLKMTPHFYRMPAEKYEQFKVNYPRNIIADIVSRAYCRL